MANDRNPRRLGSVIEIEHLHKRYGDVVAVEDVSFTVEPNEIFGIIGTNGAGKTTTVECLTGLRTPDSGTISVLGFDPVTQRDEIRTRVGVQLQSSSLPDRLSVHEALTLYASFYADPRDPDELIDLLGLTHRRTARYGKLSGGEMQRVSVGLALVGKPQVAVLDELTTGLDPHARRDVWALIERLKHEGLTVILVSHFMDEVERLCDRVAVIHRGRVVALDQPANLARPGHLEDAFVELTTA
jgi:ABC-2 type transport system ATP-binding protein